MNNKVRMNIIYEFIIDLKTFFNNRTKSLRDLINDNDCITEKKKKKQLGNKDAKKHLSE